MTISAKAITAFLALSLGALQSPAYAKVERSGSVPKDFQMAVPCPANGQKKGPCPGYERDHILPLCLRGADHIDNMQWLTVAEHRAKTRKDVAACRKRLSTR